VPVPNASSRLRNRQRRQALVVMRNEKGKNSMNVNLFLTNIILCALTIHCSPERKKIAGIENKNNIYFITAKAGLNLREFANRNSKKIILVPFQSRVDLLQIDENATTETIDGIQGKWVKIKFEGVEGWAFDSYISNKYPELIEFNFNRDEVLGKAIETLRKNTENLNRDFKNESIHLELNNPWFSSRNVKDCVGNNMKIITVAFADSKTSYHDSCDNVIFIEENNQLSVLAYHGAMSDVSYCIKESIRDRDPSSFECE